MSKFQSTKVIELGSCAFRQWRASHSHCQYVHGYQLKAKLWFGGSSLDEKNWVVDFGGLKGLKSELQYIFDHTTTVAADDPALDTFKELDKQGIIQLRIFENGVGIERCAEKVFEVAQAYVNNLTQGRCWVDQVEVFEHEENSATFTSADVKASSKFNKKLTKKVDSEQPAREDIPTESAQPQVGTPASVGRTTTETQGGWFKGTTWG